MTTSEAFGQSSDLVHVQELPPGADDEYVQRELRNLAYKAEQLGICVRMTSAVRMSGTERRFKIMQFRSAEDKALFLEEISIFYPGYASTQGSSPLHGSSTELQKPPSPDSTPEQAGFQKAKNPTPDEFSEAGALERAREAAKAVRDMEDEIEAERQADPGRDVGPS